MPQYKVTWSYYYIEDDDPISAAQNAWHDTFGHKDYFPVFRVEEIVHNYNDPTGELNPKFDVDLNTNIVTRVEN